MRPNYSPAWIKTKQSRKIDLLEDPPTERKKISSEFDESLYFDTQGNTFHPSKHNTYWVLKISERGDHKYSIIQTLDGSLILGTIPKVGPQLMFTGDLNNQYVDLRVTYPTCVFTIMEETKYKTVIDKNKLSFEHNSSVRPPLRINYPLGKQSRKFNYVLDLVEGHILFNRYGTILCINTINGSHIIRHMDHAPILDMVYYLYRAMGESTDLLAAFSIINCKSLNYNIINIIAKMVYHNEYDLLT